MVFHELIYISAQTSNSVIEDNPSKLPDLTFRPEMVSHMRVIEFGTDTETQVTEGENAGKTMVTSEGWITRVFFVNGMCEDLKISPRRLLQSMGELLSNCQQQQVAENEAMQQRAFDHQMAMQQKASLIQQGLQSQANFANRERRGR